MTTNETSAHEDTRYGDGDRTGAHRIDADSPENRDAGNFDNRDAGSLDNRDAVGIDPVDANGRRADTPAGDLSDRPEFRDIPNADQQSRPAGEVVTDQPAPDMSSIAPTPTTDAVQSDSSARHDGSLQPGSNDDGGWRELQSRFVDDPAAAVREAGALVERALADLRGCMETADTENLRTAFRKYRDLHSTLR